MPSAIYEMEPIGVDGKLEATAVHFYCSHGHAEADFEQGVYDGQAVSGPEALTPNEYLPGTVCERCCEPLPIIENEDEAA